MLIAPILADISNQMLEQDNASTSTYSKHHQLENAYTERQNKMILSYLEVMDVHDVNFDSEECLIRNIVTDQVYPENVCKDIVNCEATGKRLYEEFIEERLQPNSTVGLFDPLKKVKIETFSSCNTKKTIKVKDKIVELGQNCNLFAKCAILAQKRHIDMEQIIGFHELLTVPRSLMSSNGLLLSGGEGKSQLMKVLKEESGCNPESLVTDFDCIAIDTMCLINQMTKPTWVKTGEEFAVFFCKRIDEIAMGAKTILVAFDTYKEISLKNATRKKRQRKKVPRQFEISSSSNLSKRTMEDLLAHNATKQSLANFLFTSLIAHLDHRSVNYAVAGNSRTVTSFGEPLENNHEEGDTLIPYLLCLVPFLQRKTVVYATDTDIFVLLLKHRSKISSDQVFLQTTSDECINMDTIYEFLGDKRANALLSIHGITGCDTSGKFNHKSKEHWVRLFLKESNDNDLIEALIKFQNNFTYCELLEKYICMGYLRKKDDAVTLQKARWLLFKRSAAESQKLPPTQGAFEKHLRRAFIQINIWANAHIGITPVIDALNFGWKLDGNTYKAETTDADIAPESVINLISCGCKCNCVKRCGCLKNGLVCTDICGCGDACENTDPHISFAYVGQNDEEV